MTLEKLKAAMEAATEIRPGYLVTPDGRVFSEGSNWRGYGLREMCQHPDKHGYMRVRLRGEDGRRQHLRVHVLVAIAFHGARPSQIHEVRHLDGTRTNNAASNLAWGTRSENAHDRKRHGTERAAENGRKSAEKLRGNRNGINWSKKVKARDSFRTALAAISEGGGNE